MNECNVWQDAKYISLLIIVRLTKDVKNICENRFNVNKKKGKRKRVADKLNVVAKLDWNKLHIGFTKNCNRTSKYDRLVELFSSLSKVFFSEVD